MIEGFREKGRTAGMGVEKTVTDLARIFLNFHEAICSSMDLKAVNWATM